MKNKIIVSFMIIISLILILPNIINAATFVSSGTEGDYNFNVWDESGTKLVSLTKYNGSAKNVTVPSVIGGYPVTELYGTFYNCLSVENVVIPNGVVSIGNSTFCNASKLTTVIIPNSVTNIGNWAFDKCTNLTTITIPSNVISIGNWTFRDCKNLTGINVDINNSYYSSEDGVLFNKNKTELLYFPIGSTIKDYSIPNTVAKISDSAFYNCVNLKSVKIPSKVTEIKVATFAYCNQLETIELSDNTKEIGESAFYGCKKLKNIEIPDSTKNIGKSTFAYCNELKSIEIPSSVTTIKESTFFGCEGLSNVSIPQSVTSIEKLAFHGCSGIDLIQIPETVTNIGDSAFYGWKNSQTINFEAQSENSNWNTNWDKGCSAKIKYGIMVTSIDLNYSNIKFENDESKTLEVTITPTNAINKNLTWTSSDETVAKVDSTGKVTPVENGTCIITVVTTDGSNLSATCNVIVEKKIPEAILKIHKTDMKNNNLSGVTFEILDESKNVIDTKITDENGMLESISLPVGTYYYREVKAEDANIIIDTKLYEFKITGNGEDVEVKIKNKTVEIKVENEKEDTEIETHDVVVIIKKVDSSNEKFVLKGSKIQILDENKNVIDTKITDENGKVKFENLKIGKYYYKEIEAPKGYLLDSTEYEFSITKETRECTIISKSEVEKLPQTGGVISTNMSIVIIVAAVSIIGYIAITILAKNKTVKSN